MLHIAERHTEAATTDQVFTLGPLPAGSSLSRPKAGGGRERPRIGGHERELPRPALRVPLPSEAVGHQFFQLDEELGDFLQVHPLLVEDIPERPEVVGLG
jgi:hypothetical protein